MKTSNTPATSTPPQQSKQPERRKPVFDTVLACAVGGGTIGGFFGLAGAFLGAAIAGGFAVYLGYKHD